MISRSDRPAGVAEFRTLREITGLGAFSEEASAIALANTLHAVWLRDETGQLVAMGRLTGDGGCFAQITDVAVHPDRQRQGLGGEVMEGLMSWAETNLPEGCYLSLIADPGAEHLYRGFGFAERFGMARSV
ncbi:N-acetyltransferase [Rhodophyticola porphyridii]|uniref:N-acetyltransferase n=1 Tax=Rhodophyticola porphyridii TaxID=1852017 RepID=A0A3L9YJM1_9RHOB|nr:N-acetyltransferase [Rhodophyticola porphyridii]